MRSTRNKLWQPKSKQSHKHPEWARGSDVTIYNPDGSVKEIIPISLYRKTPQKLPPKPEQYNPRKGEKYEKWRASILKRDKRTCALCGSKDFPNAHHVERWADNVKLRYHIQNGVTLCMVCHNKHHGPHRQPFPEIINEKLIAYLGRIYGKK
jgi:ribosomal protein S27AE